LCPVKIKRERDIARVVTNTPAWWKTEALYSAERVMRVKDLFTTDDIWLDLERRGVEAPREPRCMSWLTRRLVAEKLIEWTGRPTISNLTRGNGRTVKVYRVR